MVSCIVESSSSWGQSFRNQKQLASFPLYLEVPGSQTPVCPRAMHITEVVDAGLHWGGQRRGQGSGGSWRE